MKCFHEQVLNTLNPDTVVKELECLAESDNIILVCYEKPRDFCHRHLVSDWLNKNGYKVMEWEN